MSEMILNQDNFDEMVYSSKLPVLVDFGASWCGPCGMLAPIIEELADELDGKAVVAKVDVDDSPELARDFDVESIPTVLIFRNGEVVERSVGFKQKSALLELLGEL